jgi:hypothetical protein
MVRGGSFLDVPEGCDAISSATRLPIKESTITGFRGALEEAGKMHLLSTFL